MPEINNDVFLEAVAGAEGAPANRFKVRVIRAGQSRNNKVYPSAVLKAAVPLFEGVRVRSISDEDHIKQKGSSAASTIGRLTEASWNEAEQAVMATFEGLTSTPVVRNIAEAVSRGMSNLYGLSINATGRIKRLASGLIEAQQILSVATVDLVENPGAGGAVLSLTEAVEEVTMRKTVIARLIEAGHTADQLDSLDDAALLQKLTEATTKSPVQPTTPATAPAAGVQLDAAQVQKMIEATTVRFYAKAALDSNRSLPKAAKDKLGVEFASLANLTEAVIDAKIAAELVYLGNFVESGKINLPRIEGGEANSKSMLDDFFEGKQGSFRECYIEITGDTSVSGDFKRSNRARLAEATGTFIEAVDSATFSNALGDSIARRLQTEYASNELFSDWQYLVDETNVTDFRTQERAQIGGYGNLPIVAQSGPYTALTTPSDFKATYAVAKRGGTETVTIESIANDDVGLLRRIPMEMATAAGMTLYEFIYGFLISNAAIYDASALFVAGHNNIGVTGLSAASFSAARLRMLKQTKPGSLKRINLVAKHLIVPAELEETAFDLFVRTTNNDESFVQSRKPTIHVCPTMTDTNNWYLTADKRQIALIELGFYGSKTPEIFVQDNPSVGSMFNNDTITYKIRHIYGAAVKDYRGFDGSIVA